MKGWIEVNVVRQRMTRMGMSKDPPTSHVQQVQVVNINSFGKGSYGGVLHMKNGEKLNTTESYEHLERLIGIASS